MFGLQFSKHAHHCKLAWIFIGMFFYKYKCSGAGAVRNHCMSRREIKRLGDDFALAVNRPDGICSKGVAIDSSKRLCNMKLRCAAPPNSRLLLWCSEFPQPWRWRRFLRWQLSHYASLARHWKYQQHDNKKDAKHSAG